eukprot:760467-Hanusia_phi.AAC.14
MRSRSPDGQRAGREEEATNLAGERVEGVDQGQALGVGQEDADAVRQHRQAELVDQAQLVPSWHTAHGRCFLAFTARRGAGDAEHLVEDEETFLRADDRPFHQISSSSSSSSTTTTTIVADACLLLPQLEEVPHPVAAVDPLLGEDRKLIHELRGAIGAEGREGEELAERATKLQGETEQAEREREAKSGLRQREFLADVIACSSELGSSASASEALSSL